MRILIVSNLFPPDGFGGYERACRDESIGLIDRGHDVTIVTSTLSTRNVTEENNQIRNRIRRVLMLSNRYSPAVTHPIPDQCEQIRSKLVSGHNIAVLLDQIDACKPDVVLLYNILGLGGLQILSTFDRLKLAYLWRLGDTIPAQLFDLGSLSELSALSPYVAGERRTIFGNFIAPSNRLYKNIEDQGCALQGSFAVVPNLIPATDARTRRYFKPGERLRLCYAGAISKAKGCDIAIEAVKLVRERLTPNVVLRIYGQGDVEELKQLAQDTGVSDVVEFGGFQTRDELLNRFAESDALLFPGAVSEAFGNVAVEAASQGCLPILGEDCGAAEWFQDAESCIKATRDGEGFYSAINKIVSGRIEVIDLSQKAVSFALERFNSARIVGELEENLLCATKPYSVSRQNIDAAKMIALLTERIALAQIDRNARSMTAKYRMARARSV